MAKPADNPFSRLERPRTNWPFVIVGVVLALILAVGIVLSLREANWLLTLLFAASLGVFAMIALLHIASERRLAAIDDRRFVSWNTAATEVQRQSVNVEVRELARLLEVDDDQLTDLLSAFIVAEDLALRQIQQEESLPLMRHVSIGGASFDGILVDQDLITCIEVAFLVRPDLRPERTAAIMKKIATAKHGLHAMKSRLRLRLMIVLVTQLTENEMITLRNVLKAQRFNDTPVDVDIRMLDFELLQKLYVSE
ncbi:MAG: hypothetical protein DYH05_12965 [Acidobacteria bacterium ACB1]|nr:hypothetical protein [Pyrinomonadaceae bacterium]MCE7963391.1 hypothetical protein [Acidobacteria bacterium ACB1]RIJ94140.1 MAG: hypothetical protein DCC44_05460 [Acidobacteriota bacterium]